MKINLLIISIFLVPVKLSGQENSVKTKTYASYENNPINTAFDLECNGDACLSQKGKPKIKTKIKPGIRNYPKNRHIYQRIITEPSGKSTFSMIRENSFNNQITSKFRMPVYEFCDCTVGSHIKTLNSHELKYPSIYSEIILDEYGRVKTSIDVKKFENVIEYPVGQGTKTLADFNKLGQTIIKIPDSNQCLCEIDDGSEFAPKMSSNNLANDLESDDRLLFLKQDQFLIIRNDYEVDDEKNQHVEREVVDNIDVIKEMAKDYIERVQSGRKKKIDVSKDKANKYILMFPAAGNKDLTRMKNVNKELPRRKMHNFWSGFRLQNVTGNSSISSPGKDIAIQSANEIINLVKKWLTHVEKKKKQTVDIKVARNKRTVASKSGDEEAKLLLSNKTYVERKKTSTNMLVIDDLNSMNRLKRVSKKKELRLMKFEDKDVSGSLPHTERYVKKNKSGKFMKEIYNRKRKNNSISSIDNLQEIRKNFTHHLYKREVRQSKVKKFKKKTKKEDDKVGQPEELKKDHRLDEAALESSFGDFEEIFSPELNNKTKRNILLIDPNDINTDRTMNDTDSLLFNFTRDNDDSDDLWTVQIIEPVESSNSTLNDTASREEIVTFTLVNSDGATGEVIVKDSEEKPERSRRITKKPDCRCSRKTRQVEPIEQFGPYHNRASIEESEKYIMDFDGVQLFVGNKNFRKKGIFPEITKSKKMRRSSQAKPNKLKDYLKQIFKRKMAEKFGKNATMVLKWIPSKTMQIKQVYNKNDCSKCENSLDETKVKRSVESKVLFIAKRSDLFDEHPSVEYIPSLDRTTLYEDCRTCSSEDDDEIKANENKDRETRSIKLANTERPLYHDHFKRILKITCGFTNSSVCKASINEGDVAREHLIQVGERNFDNFTSTNTSKTEQKRFAARRNETDNGRTDYFLKPDSDLNLTTSHYDETVTSIIPKKPANSFYQHLFNLLTRKIGNDVREEGTRFDEEYLRKYIDACPQLIVNLVSNERTQADALLAGTFCNAMLNKNDRATKNEGEILDQFREVVLKKLAKITNAHL